MKRIKQRLLLSSGCCFALSILATGVTHATTQPEKNIVSQPTGNDTAMKFNPGFLGLSDGKSADEINLSWFEHEGGMLPGQYRVDVMLNGEYVDTDVFIFKSSASHPGRLYACVSEERYSQWGITLPDTGTVSPSGKEGETCGEGIAGLIPGATERLNFSESQLVLSVPQAYLAPPGWLNTPSRLWDEGVPAAMVNYTVSGSSQENGGQAYDSQYLSLNTALSLKGWRLRQDSNWSRSKGSSGRWQALNTWLSHDYAWGQGGQLTLGQTSTDGSIFDSFPFEGLALSSDDGMIQPLLASFSPVFSGVAYSQAQVTVRQNGVVVYQKNVPAGPFELRDVPQLYSGDVVLEVREADGTVHRTLQTAASVPVLQREGRMRYSLVAGRYRQQDNASGTPSPNLIQGTMAWGIPGDSTIYGGSMVAGNYQAGLIGVGHYFESLGALSLDASHARSVFSSRSALGGVQQGQSYRMEYARSFSETNTSFSLTGYRYATRGFYAFNDLQQMQSGRNDSQYHQRSRLTTTISQDFGPAGQFSLSGSQDSYWNNDSNGYNWMASWSRSFPWVSASLSVGYNRTPQYNQADKSVFMSLSVPLGTWMKQQNISLQSSTSVHNSQVQQQTGVNGSLADNRLSYSVQEGWQNQRQGTSGGASVNWQGASGLYSSAYSWQRDGHQWLYGVSGGITLHQHGLTLSQPLSLNGGNALIEAPGAGNVRLLSGTGQSTDWRGYAVVPGLSPYNKNTVGLDISQLPEDAEALTTNKTLIPTRGALVAVPFHIRTGAKALITLSYNGKPVPFGSMVSVKGTSGGEPVTGIVADEGQVYMSGLPEQGTLKVSWGSEMCSAQYALPSGDGVLGRVSAVCH